MNLRVFETADDLVHGAARTIVRRAMAGSEPYRIALSGGSTPGPLYTLLGSSPMREELAARRIDWIVADERCVPLDDPQSNAGMIEKTLFAHGMSANHRFLRFPTELEPADAAARFSLVWEAFGIDALDAAIQGMGEDGHTASLFPGTTALTVDDRIATEVFVPRLGVWRVTLTMPVLQQARFMIVLAVGAGKRPVLEDLRKGAGSYPVAAVTSAVEDCWWFLDQAAAGE